jgi:hypothetical protein
VVEGRTTRRSGGLFLPLVGGLILIGLIIGLIAFRDQVWRFVQWIGGLVGDWFGDWVPNHPQQTVAIVIFAALALVLNWLAHIRGRLRAWLFVLVIEIGLWLLFWYGLGVPPLNELLGLNITRPTGSEIAIATIVVVLITGAVFWFLELREEWRKYRRRHNVVDDV